MKTVTLDPASLPELDLHEGDTISGSVSGGVVEFTILEKVKSKKTALDFLEKWSGVLSAQSLNRKDFVDDPRMLHYIEKYELEA